jgi:hypothetical protein
MAEPMRIITDQKKAAVLKTGTDNLPVSSDEKS